MAKKSNAGRKRQHPEGSVLRRTKVPPDVDAALLAYCQRQAVPPEPSAVLLAALKRFLVEEGDLK